MENLEINRCDCILEDGWRLFHLLCNHSFLSAPFSPWAPGFLLLDLLEAWGPQFHCHWSQRAFWGFWKLTFSLAAMDRVELWREHLSSDRWSEIMLDEAKLQNHRLSVDSRPAAGGAGEQVGGEMQRAWRLQGCLSSHSAAPPPTKDLRPPALPYMWPRAVWGSLEKSRCGGTKVTGWWGLIL